MKPSTIGFAIALVAFLGTILFFLIHEDSLVQGLAQGLIIGTCYGGVIFILSLVSYSKERAAEERQLDESIKNIRRSRKKSPKF